MQKAIIACVLFLTEKKKKNRRKFRLCPKKHSDEWDCSVFQAVQVF